MSLFPRHHWLIAVLFGIFFAIPGDANRFLDSLVKPCYHTFPDGSFFDLQPLARTPGRDDYVTEDSEGRMFFLNVCANVQQIPQECRVLGKLMRSPGYIVKNDSQCHWLGSVDNLQWELLDDSNPSLGVSIRYFQGERCAQNAFRQLQYQFFCDPTGRMGSVDKFLVEEIEELCMYRVTFPSKYGCPRRSKMSSGSWFLTLLFCGAAAYVSIGCAWNVAHNGARVGLEALPNRTFWENFPEHLKEWITNFIDFVSGKKPSLSARPEKEFEDLDEYEWG